MDFVENSPNPRILVVDDIVQNVELIEAHLIGERYDLITAYDGIEALEKIEKDPPDLVLLDINMPLMDGYQVCQKIKGSEATRLIPVVMITALSEVEDKVKGIESGADDFITKPFNKVELLARTKSLLKTKYLNDQLDNAERVIFALANAVEAKDKYTQGHISRVSHYATIMAQEIGLSDLDTKVLWKGGKLHDIGKIGVDDTILNKTDSLTAEEFEIIKKHPVLGYNICRPLKSVHEALPSIRWHHEKLDGSGYPDGLKGEKIPLTARIMAIMDVYDALTTQRSYRPAYSQEESFEILRDESKKGWWDLDLVDRFIKLLATINRGESSP
jgi:putative two-component system response regulator